MGHDRGRWANLSFRYRLFITLLMTFWQRGWSPFTAIRWGPGQYYMRSYVQRRFRNGSWIDRQALFHYFYNNFCHSNLSWGGYAHSMLMLPGAYGRSPLCDRIPLLPSACTVSFIYGTTDWMNYEHAEAVRESKPAAAPSIEVARVAGTGHNVPVDNPLGFVEAVLA